MSMLWTWSSNVWFSHKKRKVGKGVLYMTKKNTYWKIEKGMLEGKEESFTSQRTK